MKKRTICLSVSIFLLILSGCGKDTLPDSYIEGSDYQYMRQGDTDWEPQMQRGEKGYYFRQGEFVYYLDEGTGQLLPLCNKVDCLHDREKDTGRRRSCNAYLYYGEFSNVYSQGIVYCDGYLYCLTDQGFLDEKALYRLSEDGSRKEQVYSWSGVDIEGWIVHRGVFYYSEHFYTYDEEEEMEGHFALKALDLTDAVKEPELIYALDEENVFYLGIHWPTAYGNYVYFMVDGSEEDDSGALAPYYKTFIYDIANEEIRELTYEGMRKEETITSVTFWQDRILFVPYVYDKNNIEDFYLGEGTVYIADMDGSNVEVFMENAPMGYRIRSDGRYLYHTNSFLVYLNATGRLDYEEAETFWVYDENMELVDTLVMPDGVNPLKEPPIGDARWLMITYQADDGSWGVLRFDKSKIGSCHGAKIDCTVIPYE